MQIQWSSISHPHTQINEYKSKMETTVSELQTQLTQTQGRVSRLHDDNKRLRDQLTEKESKIIQVSARELPELPG